MATTVQAIRDFVNIIKKKINNLYCSPGSGVTRGGAGGGHGPRAQALEGAPAQLILANFKKKIRPRQIIKVTSLQCRINLAAKVPFSC